MYTRFLFIIVLVSLLKCSAVGQSEFTGGEGRGDVSSLLSKRYLNGADASEIILAYRGGIGKGDVASIIISIFLDGQSALRVMTSGGIGRGDGSASIFDTPLPIELTNFTGISQSYYVHVSWDVKTELNNDYFELEHSTNGINFNIINKVPGRGTTTEPKTYTYDHWEYVSGKNYYRLRQVDYDGKSTLSKVISVTAERVKDGETYFSLYPNPAKDKEIYLQILTDRQRPAVISIRNTNGVVVNRKELAKCDEDITIDLHGYAPGVYILEVIQSEVRSQKKFIVY